MPKAQRRPHEAAPARASCGAPGGASPRPEESAGQVVPSVPLPRFLVDKGSFRAASQQPRPGGAWPRGAPAGLHGDGVGSPVHRAQEMPAEPCASALASGGPGPAGLSDRVPSEAVWDGVTTVMIKNIPSRCHQEEVLEAIAQVGFASTYTFFYLPKKTGKMLNYGYAFVSLPTEQDVTDFRRSLDGFQFARRRSSKAIALAPAKIQGFNDNVKHFSGSRVLDSEHPPIFRMYL